MSEYYSWSQMLSGIAYRRNIRNFGEQGINIVSLDTELKAEKIAQSIYDIYNLHKHDRTEEMIVGVSISW